MEDDEDPLFRHFSHEHPLELTNNTVYNNNNLTCYGCNLNIFPTGRENNNNNNNNYFYKCKTCNFFYLHQVCYNMPQNHRHPADPNHNLLLLAITTPSSSPSSLAAAAQSGTTTTFFKCKACTENVISGFYYFCAKCGDHYHILCSMMPLSLTIPSHPHSVKLEFSPPYDFQCDLCQKPGFRGWLYRCSTGFCDYDVHLSCAIFNEKAANFLQQRHHTSNNKDTTIGSIERTQPTTTTTSTSSQPSNSTYSDDLTMSSIQLSDAYFSIDLTRSYTGCNDSDDLMNQARKDKQASDDPIYGINNGVSDDVKEGKDEAKFCHNPRLHHQNGAAILTGVGPRVWEELGQESRSRKGIGSRSVSDIKDYQTTDSDTETSGCFKLFLCCHQPTRNVRYTKNFKGGGA